jgi:hypothetical protein
MSATILNPTTPRGNARLVSRETGQEYRAIVAGNLGGRLVNRPGLGVAGGKHDENLTVESVDGTFLPEGVYDIHDDSGIIIPGVRHIAGQWVIEAEA